MGLNSEVAHADWYTGNNTASFTDSPSTDILLIHKYFTFPNTSLMNAFILTTECETIGFFRSSSLKILRVIHKEATRRYRALPHQAALRLIRVVGPHKCGIARYLILHTLGLGLEIYYTYYLSTYHMNKYLAPRPEARGPASSIYTPILSAHCNFPAAQHAKSYIQSAFCTC